eukprot:1159640-Pelagomonas_calceolata.AAC.6
MPLRVALEAWHKGKECGVGLMVPPAMGPCLTAPERRPHPQSRAASTTPVAHHPAPTHGNARVNTGFKKPLLFRSSLEAQGLQLAATLKAMAQVTVAPQHESKGMFFRRGTVLAPQRAATRRTRPQPPQHPPQPPRSGPCLRSIPASGGEGGHACPIRLSHTFHTISCAHPTIAHYPVAVPCAPPTVAHYPVAVPCAPPTVAHYPVAVPCAPPIVAHYPVAIPCAPPTVAQYPVAVSCAPPTVAYYPVAASCAPPTVAYYPVAVSCAHPTVAYYPEALPCIVGSAFLRSWPAHPPAASASPLQRWLAQTAETAPPAHAQSPPANIIISLCREETCHNEQSQNQLTLSLHLQALNPVYAVMTHACCNEQSHNGLHAQSSHLQAPQPVF